MENKRKAFETWWKEAKFGFDKESLAEDIAAEAFYDGYEAGSDDGFISGQDNMLECGYQLPQED